MFDMRDDPAYMLRRVYCQLRDELFNATTIDDIENIEAAMEIVDDKLVEVSGDSMPS